MAEQHIRNVQFVKYDSMSTDELQQILRDDASKPNGHEYDIDELLYVMDVLANRRQAQNEGKSPEEALASFHKNYFPEAHNDSSPVFGKAYVAGKQRMFLAKRGLIAAVLVLVFLMASSIKADAWVANLWDVVAKWTQETFHFGYVGTDEETNVPTPTHNYPSSSLIEALEKANVTIDLVPTWFPEGYSEIRVNIVETPSQRNFISIYQSGNNSIQIRIADYLDSHPLQIEQSEFLVEVYSVNGIDYYIFDNYNQRKVAWITDTYESTISGPLSVDEIKEMINSIGKD